MTRIEGLKAIQAVLEEVWGISVSDSSVSRYLNDPDDPLPHWHLNNRVRAHAEKVKAWAQSRMKVRGMRRSEVG